MKLPFIIGRRKPAPLVHVRCGTCGLYRCRHQPDFVLREKAA